MRILTILLLIAAIGGCMPVPTKSWRETHRAPRAGDVVRVESRKGERYTFQVYKTDDKAFYGVASDDGKKYRVPYAAIETLELRTAETTWIELPFVREAAIGAAATEVMGRILLSDFP